MKNIINIINFVRACEPREDDDSFLVYTFDEEMKLSLEYGFRTTVLLQYDALMKDEYVKLAGKYSGTAEYGLWLEIVEPLAADSGIEWRGRFPWDWHCDVGFTVGYEPEERRRLIDTAFAEFRNIFGYYPRVAGCWHIDSATLDYISGKYPLKAFCICKEQYGTDGYTLWGGYYNGAYYPCRNNLICPASCAENQINVPVFRMLGPDPVYQYDMGADTPGDSQKVASLEPVYQYGGGSSEWVDWYLNENFNGKGLALSYAQTGQENSFGPNLILPGLKMQYEKLKKKEEMGLIEILPLSESGEWFSKRYRLTPASSVCCDSDCDGSGNRTAWYSCINYRVDFHFRDNMLYIRDFYIFDDGYREKYLDKRDAGHDCGYYNLPVVDGYRFSGEGLRAGIYPCLNGSRIKCRGSWESSVRGEESISVSAGDGVTFTAFEDGITAECSAEGWYLEFEISDKARERYDGTDGKTLFMHSDDNGERYGYRVRLSQGRFSVNNGTVTILPENGKVVFSTRKTAV